MSVNAISAQDCMEEESAVDECYRPLSAEEKGGDGTDAFGPGGDEFGDEVDDGELGVKSDAEENFGDSFFDNWEERAVDGVAELRCVNFKEITAKESMMCHFLDRSVAFLFYSLYAKMNGFAVRKNKIRRNVRNEITQQEFVCFRQGFRGMGSVNYGMRHKHEPKAETRCGCEAEMRVHVHSESGRWIISYFQDFHNHEMLDDRLTFMLPGHRKMDAAALEQMNMMLRVGIKTPQIYSSFVQTAGGFQNLPFLKRDMYNQIGKQRRIIGGDATACLKFLESTAQANPGMFVRYLADKDGRLVHLFWSDNCSQLDYDLFGDVVAFDATYRKNKYMCPLVVFSGVNHHNQMIVFAAVLVANENEQTYTWLLQQFLDAMESKAPGCVITDGHGAMKKAIEAVFPEAYHRLCAWHLLRNATSNLSNPRFTSKFKKCMLFDYEVWEFEDHWHYMVDALGLSDNQWVSDLYSRRRMWATAHIRGNFFGGFRTTSRCEGLHSMLGKFVQSRHNLRDFVEQFMRCISQMRSREAHSDLLSVVGEPVLQSPFHDLERSAAKKLTRAIFFNFRPMFFRACTPKVRTHTWTQTSDTFTLCRSANVRREWQVCHYSDSNSFKCSCLRMESLGIPCDHIVAVLVHLEMTDIPDSLVLDRWSKSARSKVRAFVEKGPFCWDSTITCRNWMLNDLCREMSVLACRNEAEFADMTDKVLHEIAQLKEIEDSGDVVGLNEVGEASTLEGCVRDPQLVRCQKRQRKETVKGVKRCGLCRQRGHNQVSCHLNPNSRMNTQEGASYFGGEGEGETGTMEDSSEEEELLTWDDAADLALDEGYDSQGRI